ncbi:Cytochrome P450 87A3 [Linum perenne]
MSLAVLIVVLSASLFNWFRKSARRYYSATAKLPPGSSGLPFVGETFQFFVPYTSADISPFVKKRVERYGPVFRTNLIGHPIVVSTDPEINAFVFKKDEELFKTWYTDSFGNIMGNDGLMYLQGSVHKYLRNLTLHEFGPHNLKSMLPDLEQCAAENLKIWSTQPSVNLKEVVSEMIHRSAVEKMFSLSDPKTVKELKQSFDAFLFGLISFPIYFPGTAYWKCMQGRNRAIKIIKKLLEERPKAQVKKEQSDYIDFILSEMEKDGSPLTKNRAIDLLFILTFATFESTSSAIVSAFYYLTRHPAALEQLTKEHEDVVKRREEGGEGINWEEYKSMTFTHMVINETIRLTNVVPGIFRKALKDVEIKGYLIPAGWTVMVYPTAVHLNPNVYDDPLAFNPWRWEGQKLHVGSQNFMAFGGGGRVCAGADYVKVHMAILLHHIATKYKYASLTFI